MTTTNISLPDKMKEWVESRAATGAYSNASDYVRDLIRRDKDSAETRAWFEAEIEKGYASGFAETTVDDLFKDAEALAASRRKIKKSA